MQEKTPISKVKVPLSTQKQLVTRHRCRTPAHTWAVGHIIEEALLCEDFLGMSIDLRHRICRQEKRVSGVEKEFCQSGTWQVGSFTYTYIFLVSC